MVCASADGYKDIEASSMILQEQPQVDYQSNEGSLRLLVRRPNRICSLLCECSLGVTEL